MGKALRAKGEALRGEVIRLLWVDEALPPHMAVRLRLTVSESKPLWRRGSASTPKFKEWTHGKR